MQRLGSVGTTCKPWGLSKEQEAFLMSRDASCSTPEKWFFFLMSKSSIKLLEKFTPKDTNMVFFNLGSRQLSVHHGDVCMPMWSCLRLEEEVPIYYSPRGTKSWFICPVLCSTGFYRTFLGLGLTQMNSRRICTHLSLWAWRSRVQGWDCSSVAGCLAGMHEVLGSNFSHHRKT